MEIIKSDKDHVKIIYEVFMYIKLQLAKQSFGGNAS